MTKHPLRRIFLAVASGMLAILAATASAESAVDLQTNGAFGFPQNEAKVLCDLPSLRFSVWNNSEYLFAQAVLWTDDDDSLGMTDDNRPIGDWSELMLDLDANGKPTANVDRDYMLNPWPNLSGLHYIILLGEDYSTTGILNNSKGRGAIRYLNLADGKRVRVDTYLVPLEEISRKVGDKIRLCYWGESPKPTLTVNSAGYDNGGKPYYSYSVPMTMYHDYLLAAGGKIEATQVPEGRSDISLSHRNTVKPPEVGQAAPEISAKDWINLEKPVTLQSLRGKVVLVEFWATWCGPCVEGIPHLNELQRKYGSSHFQFLSLVEEGHKTMDPFLEKKRVEYPIGVESGSLDDYGVEGIPHAFVIDPVGKIVWQGNSDSPEMEKTISTELGKIK